MPLRMPARGPTLLAMTKTLKRIVLSLPLILVAACAPNGAVELDDDPITADGIGTSPSECVGACDPEGIAVRRAPEPDIAPPSCGVWFDVSTAAADARALACTPPDAIVHAGKHSTCVDALGLASLHGWTLSVVRRLAYNGAAIESDCP